MKIFKHIQNPSPLSRKNVVVLLLMYFVFYLLLIPIAMVLVDRLWIPGFLSWTYTEIIFHTIMTLVFLFLGSKLLHESNKHWSIMSIYIPIIAAMVMLWVSIFYGMALTSLTGQGEPVNQSLIYEMFKLNKVAIMVQALIFAPIVEEIIFRGVIYRHFKKAGRYLLPLIISTLLFALMHSLNAILDLNWIDLLYLPLYAFMSLILTYTYEQTQNLYSSILLHFINNTISILAMLYAIEHSIT